MRARPLLGGRDDQLAPAGVRHLHRDAGLLIKTVLFWDIDGTLLLTGRASFLALEEAAREMSGGQEVDLSTLHTAGMTDALIAAQVLQGVAVDPSEENVRGLLDVYEQALPLRLPERQGEVMPGVREVLEHMHARDDVLQLLLTGNTRAGARAKLSHYGLIDLVDDGAFCTDSSPREEVARRAVALAEEQLGEPPALDRTYVIGDTPRDIACGKAVGARTIAVATGPYPLGELEAQEPWAVLEQLPEPGEFARLVGLKVT